MKARTMFLGILLTVFVACTCGIAGAAEFTMKVGYVVPESYPHHIAARDFLKTYIEKESGGRIEVELYPNGQLGGDRQLCESIQLGALEMAFPSTTYLATFMPELQILDFPYLFSSREEVYKVLDGEIGAAFAARAKNEGFYLLGFADIGFMHLTNSDRAIHKPEDTAGLKIRVMENPVYIDTAKAMGYNPTPMSFGEVYTALQQGVVDGQQQSINVIRNMKFYDVQKYLSMTGEAYATISIIASESFMDSLPEDLKTVVRKGVQVFCKEQRNITTEQEVANLKELKDKGMEVNELTDAERKAFVEATRPVREKYSEKAGKKLYEDIEALLK